MASRDDPLDEVVINLANSDGDQVATNNIDNQSPQTQPLQQLNTNISQQETSLPLPTTPFPTPTSESPAIVTASVSTVPRLPFSATLRGSATFSSPRSTSSGVGGIPRISAPSGGNSTSADGHQQQTSTPIKTRISPSNTGVGRGQSGIASPGGINTLSSRLDPRRRIQASKTFAEGMTHSVANLRHRNDPRRTDHLRASGSAAGVSGSAPSSHPPIARPVMPRSRPSWAQIKPLQMVVPPPYGQDKAQEPTKAFSTGIALTHQNHSTRPGLRGAGVMSDSGSSTDSSSSSDDEPVIRVTLEVRLQQEANDHPICPLNDQNLKKLVQELDLTEDETAIAKAIETQKELGTFLCKLPRSYGVKFIIQDSIPSPEVRFAEKDEYFGGDEIKVLRTETIATKQHSHKRHHRHNQNNHGSDQDHRPRSLRHKKRYRRPTTDLSIGQTEDPKATWLELFYDLLFVANLNQFTHAHPITDGLALGNYIAWFTLLWWSWASQTFWASRYDMDDLFSQLLKLIEFGAMISFGAFSNEFTGSTVYGFTISYIVLKAVLLIGYLNVLYWARRNKSTNSLAPLWIQIASIVFAMLGWGLSLLCHSQGARYAIWYVTIAFEIAALVGFGRRSSVTFAGSGLPERFALLTIIVLGENIIGLLSLTAGASTWSSSDQVLGLFFLLVVILYGLWFLYFSDFSEDVFHQTTMLSQLWAYLHLPLHICIVLIGTGALDLIRLYKAGMSSLDHTSGDSVDIPNTAEHFASNPSGSFLYSRAETSSTATTARQTDYDLTKQYFIVACAVVFLCNSLLKWINLRTYDRFQRIVYISRFLNSLLILCLLAVPLDRLTPYALLGSMCFFCVVQVAVDLLTIYYGAYGFVEGLEQWASSARSSMDLGSLFLTSPKSRSRASSQAGSTLNLANTNQDTHQLNVEQLTNSLARLASKSTGSVHSHPKSPPSASTSPKTAPLPILSLPPPSITSTSTAAGVSASPSSPNFLSTLFIPNKNVSPLEQEQQLQQMRQQQALHNMHLNSNSVGTGGAYGNLALTLAQIRSRGKTLTADEMDAVVAGRAAAMAQWAGGNSGSGTLSPTRTPTDSNNVQRTMGRLFEPPAGSSAGSATAQRRSRSASTTSTKRGP